MYRPEAQVDRSARSDSEERSAKRIADISAMGLPVFRHQFGNACQVRASGSSQYHFDASPSEFLDNLGGRGRVGDQHIKLFDLCDH